MCSCKSVIKLGKSKMGRRRQAFLRWSRLPELNRRPTDYESVALPTELSRLILRCDSEVLRRRRNTSVARLMCNADSRSAPNKWAYYTRDPASSIDIPITLKSMIRGEKYLVPANNSVTVDTGKLCGLLLVLKLIKLEIEPTVSE